MTKAMHGDRRQIERDRANDLRERIPALLASGDMTTKNIAATLNADPGVVYRVLLTMRRAGKVGSMTSCLITPTGPVGATWSIIEKRSEQRIPARDPLLWAVFGVAVGASA